MTDSYHTVGAERDRQATAKRETERNVQLARIADALEALVESTKLGGPLDIGRAIDRSAMAAGDEQ